MPCELYYSFFNPQACYHVTKDMEKKFCPKCGNATLLRTSIGVDSSGQVILYLKKNFQYNTRGTVYSVPAPKGGKHSKDLILREDQKENCMRRKKASPLENIFDDTDINLKSKDAFQNGPQIGYGRRNPNEKSRRSK